MYHALADLRSPISCPPRRFAEHLRWLHAAGVVTWTVADLVSWLVRGAPPTPPAVVLTFDDGFRSVLEHGLPALARYGYRGTVFVVSGHVGGRNDWPTQPAGVPRWPLLAWAELRTLAAAGMEIGAHSVTHPWLPGLTPADLRHEVVGSKRALEQGLGQPVHSFAYPYGGHDTAVRRLVAATYSGACAAEAGRATAASDRWRLPRVEVRHVDARFFFHRLGRPGLEAWIRGRGLLRDLRARGTGRTPRRRTPADDGYT